MWYSKDNITKQNYKRKMLQFYKATAVHMVTYGSECWAVNKADRRAVEAAEMKFLLYVAGYTNKDQY
jgi:hypothetical protein